ncbi:uncharacterized protein LOC129787134 [Lutzomyia longipalpis]|uniref:uncharacterized protein LOC129787134 n=1 Tax=Lutzomyia longipalpis TaxID=7200 RepID=UPI0024842908|nr:uncharacterized protein LOC129787134 [Lutzomyia longipalpis]XP_055678458.1 uncharacterized protein LOC129787134 [Lutzomyia longipalpis]
MVFRKLMERMCIVLCKRHGIPLKLFMLRCERDVLKRQKRWKNFVLQSRSFFMGSRVVIKVPPHRKFRQKDRDIHRHFNWATVLWHKFNGVKVQIGEYLMKKKEKAARRREARRNRKRGISKESKEVPKDATKEKTVDVAAEDSSDEVQLINDYPVIDLASDDEDMPEVEQLSHCEKDSDEILESSKFTVMEVSQPLPEDPQPTAEDPQPIEEDPQPIEEDFPEDDKKNLEISLPQIVSVSSAVARFDSFEENPPIGNESHTEALDDIKPTNEELERARQIFSSLKPETGEDVKEGIYNALYSLDTLSEADDSHSLNHSTDKTFLDSLANKLGVEGGAGTQARTEKSFEDCYQELEQTFKRVNAVASSLDDVAVKDEDTSSSTEFYGFNENDLQTPGLLRTPHVRQAGSYSAFVSQKYDSLLERLGPVAIDRDEKSFYRRYNDEEKINRHSLPPKLECPDLPLDMKSRTLAEKKQMLRIKPIGYQVMDQENSVYQLLKKRLKAPLDDKLFDQAQRIMRQPVPMRRNVWKTATWLNTRENHYIYRYITFEGREIKLFGCVGNYVKKHVRRLDHALPGRMYTPRPKLWCCKITGFPRSIKFNNLREKEPVQEQEKEDVKPIVDLEVQQTSSPVKKKWNLIQVRKIPPGPLCTKPKNAEKNENLAPLDTYELPQVLLQLWPKINQPFPLKVKRYLSEMCPYEELTEQWIEFALAALKDVPELEEPIEFEIPYENNRKKILVSRDYTSAIRRSRTTEVFDDSQPLKFREDLPDDPVLHECADILEDMVNSVAIGMAEDDFSKCDPDLDYAKQDSQKRFLEAPKDQEAPAYKKPRSSALLAELKRLNATIINTENIPRQKECNQEHCKKGCICDSIATLACPTSHCEDPRCMFECVCGKGLNVSKEEINPFSKEVFRIRDKAISRLARAEKDFSSTVVLTNNNTFLLSNSSEEKSKRSRTVPRKFGDYVRTEVAEEELLKGKTVDATVRFPSVKGKRGRRQVDPEIEKMRHVSVVLRPITHIVQNMEPWCMIHELYRCFCKGDAVSGKPFLLTQVDGKHIALSEELVAKPSEYRKLSKKSSKNSFDSDPMRDVSLIVSEDNESQQSSVLTTSQISQFMSPAAAEMDNDDAIIADYLQNIQKARIRTYKRGEPTAHIFRGSVSRCVPFNKSTQVILNKQNAHRVRKFIYAMERTPLILSLLKRRYTESVSKSRKEIQRDAGSKLVPAAMTHTDTLRSTVINNRKDYSGKRQSQGSGKFVESNSGDAEYSNAIPSLDASSVNDQSSNSATDPVVPVISSVTSLNTQKEVRRDSFDETSGSQEHSQTDVQMTLLNKLNMMVSKMMTTIAKNEEKLMLDAPQINKITTIKWINLLQGYRSYTLHMWEVHYTEKLHLLITRSNKVPEVPPGYIEIFEVRKMRNPSSEFSRMLAQSYDLKNIDKYAALLFGHKDYWQVIGFLNKTSKVQNSATKYLSVSKETHPQVASKISKLYDILLAKVTKVPTSNVQIMSSEQIQNAKLLKFPLPSQPGQRWFMLVITNDFSDISHPKWGQLLSYDRIRYAIAIAEKNGRTVQVKSNNSISLNPSVYVTPHASDRIFIGPYGLNEECDIILYQRMDGSILLRETYEKTNNIKRTSSTMGCWIQLKPRTVSQPNSVVESNTMQLDCNLQDASSPRKSQKLDDDDDCVVVEADPKEIKAAEEAHEAEEAVNSILPDGLKLPTVKPKKISRNEGERKSSDAAKIRVVPDHVLTARSSPAVSDEDLAPSKKRLKRASMNSDISDTPLANLKDLTVIPMDEDEDAPEWAVPSNNLPALTITSVDEAEASSSSSGFPVISKVVSLGDDKQQTKDEQVSSKLQQSLLRTNRDASNKIVESNDDSLEALENLTEDGTEKNKKLTPFEEQFAQYLEDKETGKELAVYGKSYNYRRKYIKHGNWNTSPHHGGKDSLRSPKEASDSYYVISNENEEEKEERGATEIPRKIKIVKSIKPPSSIISVSSLHDMPSPQIVGIPVGKPDVQQPKGNVKVAYTSAGKKVIIRQMPPKEGSSSSNAGLKRSSPPPLAIPTKKFKPAEGEGSASSSVPLNLNSLLPYNTNNCIQIGQTMLHKVPLPATSTLAVVKTSPSTASSTVKTIPKVICNGLGSQMLKVKVNIPSSSTTSTATLVNLPKTTVPSLQIPTSTITAAKESLPTSSTSPIVVPSSVAVKVPGVPSTLLDSSKTITITRTTPDGKAMKFVLPVSSIQPIYKVPGKMPPLMVVSSPTSSTSVPKVQSVEKCEEVCSQTGLPTESPGGRMSSPSDGDIIDLSDDEEVEQQRKAEAMKEKIASGWIVSSIPQLGYIPARMVDKSNYLMELPTRKHPFKVGCNCIDRYMDRYMKYCVMMYLPEDLSVRWEFVEGDPQKQPPGEKFTLQASTNKERLILTPNGVMDMEFPVQRELIDCPSVYTRLLLMHLVYVSVGELKPTKGIEVVEKALKVIEGLKDTYVEQTKTIQKLQDKQRELKQHLKILTETCKLPTVK